MSLIYSLNNLHVEGSVIPNVRTKAHAGGLNDIMPIFSLKKDPGMNDLAIVFVTHVISFNRFIESCQVQKKSTRFLKISWP